MRGGVALYRRRVVIQDLNNLINKYLYCVGGEKFKLRPRPAVELYLPFASYKEFMVESERESSADNIVVDIVFGRIPEFEDRRTVFKTENAWSIFRIERDYLLELEGESPVLVRFSAETRQLTIFCSGLPRGKATAKSPLHYPLDQIFLMHHLSAKSGVIAHSAGIVFKRKGFIFAGKSGAGKSTISRKLLGKMGCLGLSDDRMIVKKAGDSFMIYGTPWPGDAGIAVNRSAQLSRIFFLVQSKEDRIELISEAEAFRWLMPVLSVPWYDKEAVDRIFSFVEELISKVPVHILYFTPDIEVDFLEEFVSEQ